MDWIARHEPDRRGWYAGPFGWLDEGGDGDFVVALRCALLDDRRVHLFAGAGIVDGSVPEAEFDETEWKLRTLRAALEVVETEPA